MSINKFVTIVLLLSLVTLVWQLLEIIFYGKIQADDVDSIIAIILTASLYYNIKNWILKKR